MRKRSVYSGYVVLEEPAEEFQVREQSETITRYRCDYKIHNKMIQNLGGKQVDKKRY